MKVILLQNVKELGNKNDIKNVADGYAKNYLLPNKIAVLATNNGLEVLEETKEAEAQKAEEELLHFQELAEQIDGTELEISAKVSDNGKLFGSVTTAVIADKLKELGFNVDKDQVNLKEPIKELGEYDVILEFPHNLEAKIKVIVTASE